MECRILGEFRLGAPTAGRTENRLQHGLSDFDSVQRRRPSTIPDGLIAMEPLQAKLVAAGTGSLLTAITSKHKQFFCNSGLEP